MPNFHFINPLIAWFGGLVPNIHFVYPLVFWIGVPVTVALFAAAGWYNTLRLHGLRKHYAGDESMIHLDRYSPRNNKQVVSVWVDWTVAIVFFVVALAMPNGTFAPDLVRKGAVYVEFVIQVNNAMGDESDRKYHPEGDPGVMYQWGTRLDMVKRFIVQDMLPQLKGNKTGLTTVEGKGFNLWDLDQDNEDPTGGFRVMLDSFAKIGSAPDAGANYASGFQTALDEFDLIKSQDKKEGDTGSKEYFIVLFADGNFRGDKDQLSKVLAELAKRKIHLLIVGMGEAQNVSVPKYDPTTHQRSGVYEGETSFKPDMLQSMQKAVPGAEFIYAPPGTEHIKYSFPSKSAGLYAVPHDSNLYGWFVLVGLLAIVKVTVFGGRWPKWRFIVHAFEPLWQLRRYISNKRQHAGKPE